MSKVLICFFICLLSGSIFSVVPSVLYAGSISNDNTLPSLLLEEKDTDPEVNTVEGESRMEVGLGIGFWMIPEELDYRSQSIPAAVLMSWKSRLPGHLSIQAGYSVASATLNYEAYKAEWENRLTTSVTYLSYRMLGRLTEATEVYLLAGPAYLSAELQVNRKTGDDLSEVETYRDAGFGYILGTGLSYRIGWFAVGLEMNTVSHTGRFNEIENATGFSQAMVTGRYRF